MRIIVGKPGTGKTLEAIRVAAKTSSYILTPQRSDAIRICDAAETLGLKIRNPVTLEDMLRSNNSTGFVRGLVIDDLDRIIHAMYRRNDIHLVTMSEESDEE